MSLVETVKKEAFECVQAMSVKAMHVNWTKPEVYASWLSQTYFYVRHATRVLAFAASRCSHEEEGLHLRLIQGITEEKGHEILAIRDLKSLGFQISQFEEFSETSAYYQTLFCNIGVDGPCALLGYFIPLEGLAAIGLHNVLKTVNKEYGDNGSSFLRMHCVVDEGHFSEGMGFLDHLSEPQLNTVRKHLKLSTALYIHILDAVIESVAAARLSGGKKKAA